jgi:hypothetical protein
MASEGFAGSGLRGAIGGELLRKMYVVTGASLLAGSVVGMLYGVLDSFRKGRGRPSLMSYLVREHASFFGKRAGIFGAGAFLFAEGVYIADVYRKKGRSMPHPST